MAVYDEDKDGHYSREEVEKIVKDLTAANLQTMQASKATKKIAKDYNVVKQAHRELKRNIKIVAAVLVVFVAVLFSVTFATNELAKESHVVEQADLPGGGDAGMPDVLVSKSGKPVATVKSQTEHALSSRIPDRYLAQLQSFTVTKADGGTLFANVLGFKREPDEFAHCGSIVVLNTTLGKFTLDDEELWVDGTGAVQVEGVFGAGGKPSRRLTPHTNTPHEDHAQHGRRLDVKKLLGLYDYFEKENFTCTSSWQGKTEDIGPKPFALPVTFTTVKRVHCTSPVEGDTGRCASALFPGIMKPGVSDDEKTMVTVAETLITDTLYVEFASFANHPYAKKVYVRDSSSALETGNDTITTFVVWTGGRANVFLQEDPLSNTSAPNVGNNATLEKVHCRRKERRTRPSFNFAPFYPSYLGVETDDEDSSRNLRKWRMSPREGVNITNGAGFIMWDDYATRVPRKFQDLTLDLGYSTMSAFDDNLTAGEVASWFQTYLPGESIDSLSITPNNLDQVDCLNSTNVVAGYTPNTNSYALPDFDAVLGPAEFEENREELALYLAVTLEAESAIPPFPIEGDPSDALFPVSKDRYWKELIDTARDIESQFDEGEFGEDVLEDRRLFDVHEEETSQLEVTPIHEANRGMQMRRRLEYFKCYEKMTCPCGAARSLFTRTTHNWGTCMQISSLSDLPGQLSSYAELLEHDDKLLKVKQDTKASTTGSKKKVDIMPPDFKLMVKIGSVASHYIRAI